MIIFELILTNFEASIIFRGNLASRENQIGSSLNLTTKSKINEVKLFQILDSHCWIA